MGTTRDPFMNVLRLWKIYRAANRVLSHLQEAHMGKIPWKSKTLWFNVLTAAASLAGVVPMDPATLVLVTSGINFGLRLITGQPITFTPKD